MSEGYTTVTAGDFQVSSNSESAESMLAGLSAETVEIPAESGAADPNHSQLEPAAETGRSEPSEPVSTDKSTQTDASDTKSDRNTDGTFKARKPRNDPQARIDQVIAKQKEVERERDQLRAELDAARRPVAPVQPQPPTVQATTDAEPNPDDATKYPQGQYDRAYLKDQARWEARQEYAQQRQADDDRRAKAYGEQTARQQAAAWDAKVAKVRAETPDWETRFKPTTPFNMAVMPWLAQQDDGPQVLLYLSDHQDLAQRLVALPPISVIAELGKIQARLEAASRGPVSEPRVSHASAPIRPLAGGESSTDPSSGEEETFDQLYERDQKRRKAGR